MVSHKMLILMLASTLLLSGCWDRQELNDIAIVVGMGIDKHEDEIVLSVQIVNPGNVSSHQAGGTQSAPVITYTEKGKSVMEIIRKLTTISPRKLYFSHLRIVVIGEEAAQEGIAPLLDFLSRDHELRSDFFMLVSRKVDAVQILEVTTLMDRIPSNKMFNSLKTSEKYWAVVGTITIDQVVNDMAIIGEEAVLTGIKLIGSIEEGSSSENISRIALRSLLQYDGLAIFKDDRLVGWLNEQESKAYNYIKGNASNTLYVFPCKDEEGYVGLEVERADSKVQGSVKNSTPSIDIKIELIADIGEVQCKLNLSDEEVIYDLEKQAEDYLKMNIKKSINTIQQQYGSDIYGFGQAIHRSNPSYWNKNKHRWDELFKDLEVRVSVDLEIKNIGGYSQYIHMEEE